MVPAEVPVPPDAADIVKLVPARMFPSKSIAPELPTLIVAASSTIQKMLSACAPSSNVNVIAPFTVRSPGIWMMKSAEELPPALKVRLVPVVVEMVPNDVYTPGEKVWLVAAVNDPSDVKPSAVLNAPPEPKTALYAAVTVELLGAG
jgi:hypothetical protein